MAYIYLVRRMLRKLKLNADFDGQELKIRFGPRELVITGNNLQVELKGIR